MNLPVRKPPLLSVLTSQCPEPKAGEHVLDQFLRGVICGDLCEDDSAAYLSGQVVAGFVPGLGQGADVRDFWVAADHAERGEPGADWMLFAAAIGFVPGLDFLKGGAKAARRELVIASKELGKPAVEGLERVAKRVDAADLKRLNTEVRVLSAARTEALARIKALREMGGWDPRITAQLRKAENAISHHLKSSDLAGALRDVVGDPVELGGRVYQHEQEVRDAAGALQKLRERMAAAIERRQARGEEWVELSKDLDFLSEYQRRIMRLLGEKL